MSAKLKKRDSKLTAEPVEIPPSVASAQIRPEFLRLPKGKELCPHTGMARGGLNELILPTERNSNKPPVKSFVLRKRGARTGIRLIDYQSLIAHIRAHPEGLAA